MLQKPSYLKLLESGQLEKRIDKLKSKLEPCSLCPRMCKVNRRANEYGVCRSGMDLNISSYNAHFGEEAPLVGRSDIYSKAGGSGTIFLTNCNLLCDFCQNFDISHKGDGEIKTIEETADIMLYLQDIGCLNINFVTPTHYAPQLIEALGIAGKKGLKLPIVWNSSGYERVEVLKLLDGIVDIYLPDFKFASEKSSMSYCSVPDYYERACGAVLEMYRQVGDLKTDKEGNAERGLMIRHLFMPGGVMESKKIIDFISKKISLNSYLNIMPQYRPSYKAYKYEEINDYPDMDEYRSVISYSRNKGIIRGL